MRLSNFVVDAHNLNEGVLSKLLKNMSSECSEILNIYQDTFPDCLFRASDELSLFNLMERTPRMDREPRDSPKQIHKMLNEMFEELFGWKVRSEGVFTTSSFLYADIFGRHKYYIFPTNGFKYVYNKTGYDRIYTFLRSFFNASGKVKSDFSEKEITDVLKRLIKHEYTDKNLKKAIKEASDVEIIIKCNKYYSLYANQNNTQALGDFLESM
jgi:hypothetical protein